MRNVLDQTGITYVNDKIIVKDRHTTLHKLIILSNSTYRLYEYYVLFNW